MIQNATVSKRLLLFCLAVLVSALQTVPATPLHVSGGGDLPATSLPRFKRCKKPPLKIPKGQQYEFGYLEVLENRDRPDGPTIQLPVYIFKCRSAVPAKDPILYTVGGPGGSTMFSATYAEYYDYLEDRDFIFFEQRGTAFAKPCLDCPELDAANQASTDPRLSSEAQDALFTEAAQACRDRLTKQGIDLNAYNSLAIVADIEDLRQTLGIAQWNLLTISYSTKIAQLLMRDHPETLRSVVMDSPLPLETNWDEVGLSNAVNAMDKLFRDCAEDSACASAFPKLKSQFYSYMEGLEAQPLTLEVTHPKTKENLTFRLTGKDLFFLFVPQVTRGIDMIPLRIQRLLEGDYSEIKSTLASLLGSDRKSRLAMGMRISVWCAEEYPFVDRDSVQAEMDRYPMLAGTSPWVIAPEVCDLWRVSPAQPSENVSFLSSVPTLVINGEYDSATPMEWGAQMVERLENGYHIVFKGWAHTPTSYWSKPCGMAVARAFFNNPSQSPTIPCQQALAPPKFKTTEE